MSSQYKYKIDKELLSQFFLSYPEPPTQDQLKEVRKVINVVVIKHYSNYNIMMDDLVSFALTAVLVRREKYDPSFSAYNYIYSICRNEIGNSINKLTKEVCVEDILSLRERILDSSQAELPPEVERYKQYLTGERDFNYFRIPKKDVLTLILFLRMFDTGRDVVMPSFLGEGKKTVKLLYKLLKEKYEL